MLEQKKIWVNAHEMRDSISLISYARCLGLSSPVISAKIHSLNVRRSLKSRKIHQNPAVFFYFKVVKVIDVGTRGKLVSSAC